MRNILVRFSGMLMVAACVAPYFATASTDEELRERIVGFLRPHCGGNRIEGVREPELMEVLDISNDTSRLARILAEVAQTNNAWYSEMAMWQLEKYGTPAQLPFLYSCATNPVVGNRAVMAIFNIESVTSNSVDSLQRYLTLLPTSTETMYDKSVICRDTLRFMAASAAPSDMQAALFRVVRGFVANVSLANSMIDPALMAADGTYRYSRRRLADLRAAYPRCFNEYQTNYVTNAINELVAYPEANLPE